MMCDTMLSIKYMQEREQWCAVTILVFSDSHSGLSMMRRCMEKFKPQAVIHLGDFYEDAEAIQDDYRHIPFHIVAGNCDRNRCPLSAREMLCYPVGGVMMFMAHGHNHKVKMGLGALLNDARRYGAQIALFGHTHQACCVQEEDGLVVMNPGTCAVFGGSAGLIETDGKKITACRIITQADLEDHYDINH